VRLKSFEHYREARAQLDACNKAIDLAPARRTPVFSGVAELHAAVTRYEREHNICNVERVN